MGVAGQCAGCHPQAPARFKPEPKLCGEGRCHGDADADAHRGSLGKACDQCHSETREWSQPTFDHNDPRASRRFRLTGQHLKVPCASCHPRERTGTRYRPIATACESCHVKSPSDDPHRDVFGSTCARCHDPSSWTRLHTGHAASPQPLGGAHDRLPCATCHTKKPSLRGQGSQCITCHQRDDIHHNGLGPRCGDCHTQQTFAAARFSHDRVGCTLRGVHRVLPCVDCHKAGNYAGLAATCVSCHRDDAIRAAAAAAAPELHLLQSACTRCHNTVSFRGATTVGTPPESVCQ